MAEKGPQECRFVAASATLIVTPERGGHIRCSELALPSQVFKDQFEEPAERDSVGLSDPRKQPVGQLTKLNKG